MTTTNYGEKYAATKDLTRVEIAKLIRADIKAAVAVGSLPKAKYSVTCERFSGGGSIDITVAKVEGISVHNAERLLFEHDHPHAYCRLDRFSVEMAGAIAKLERIHADYNYDGSDIQSDYFNVRYYGRVTVEGDECEAAELVAALQARATLASKRPALTLVARAPVAAQNDFLAHIGAL